MSNYNELEHVSIIYVLDLYSTHPTQGLRVDSKSLINRIFKTMLKP